MISYFESLGRVTLDTLHGLGVSWMILMRSIFRLPNPKKGFPLLVQQLYSVGVMSLVIIVVSALFIGMVVGLQGYNTLVKFGATSQLGPMVALIVVRELGPVIGALLFVGRAGSALTAEIALMKATDQLAGMSMMAVDPLKRVVAPRFWAGFFSLPMLVIVFDAISVYGGYLVIVQWLGIHAGTFWSNMQANVSFYDDVLNGIIKSIVFGFFITWIAVYQGYSSEPTSVGMSRATTKTVVYSSLAVLGLDFVLTTMMMGGW